MKNRFHVFSRMFTKMNVFLFLLFALLMVPSAWAADINVTTTGQAVIMPTTGTLNATILEGVKSFKVYDDGGSSGNYSKSSDGLLVLTAPTGYVLELTGSIKTGYTDYSEGSYTCDWDAFLNVFDGLGSFLVFKESGCTEQNGPYWNSLGRIISQYNTNIMKLYFISNGKGYTSDGLDLTVTLIPIEKQITYTNVNSGGTVTSSSPKKANFGSTVNYIYNYTNGYLVRNIEVVAENGDAVKVNGGWYNDKKASFIMPLSDVTVKSTYTNNLTAAGGLYINMPETGTLNATIPEGVKSFKVYDDGGSSGNYSKISNGTLVLTAPTGYVFELTGSIKTGYTEYFGGSYTCNWNAFLSVYNGSSTSANLLDMLVYEESGCSASSGPYWKPLVETISQGRIVSQGNTMTLNFKSNGWGYASDGLDLTVTLIPIKNQITYTNVNSGGSVTSSSPKMANIGETVNYTYDYTSGYLICDIDVVAENGDAVKVNGGWYNDKKASFIMPPSKVKVWSTYTNNLTAAGGLYINMPRKGTLNATIPEGVKSFKVYDDGGKDGDYSKNGNGVLVLSAPTGYELELTGSIKTGYKSYSAGSYTCNWNDFLNVHDGSDTSAIMLVFNEHGCSASSGSYWNSLVGISSNGRIISQGKTMTLNFKSDGWEYASDGLDLTVTLIPVDYTVTVANVAGGSLADVPKTAYTGDTVSLTAVPTNSNYMLVKFVVKDAAGNELPVIRNTLTEGKFKMPASNVTITPVFADTRSTDITATDGFHLDMTRNRKVTINLPKGVKSFNLYDHGGKTSDYSIKSGDTLVFTVPTGYHFKVTGSIYTQYKYYDHLYVHDGASVWSSRLFSGCSATNGEAYDVGTIETSSNSMTVDFFSDNSGTYAGLDLLVTVVPNSYTVAIEQMSGGTVSSDKESAIAGEKVTLTVAPDEGYMLNGFVIKDASGKSVPFRGGDFIDKKGSFTMPAGNVTVTPVFTNKLSTKLKGDLTDIFLTIPVTGVKTVVLPEGLNAFKVYDDGGSTGLLTQGYNANGTLVLIAPENAKINATVVAGVASPATFKTYDGESTDATLLGSAEIGYREKYNSTGNAITFNMTTSETRSGTADININVLAKRNINVVSADGGTATSDKTTADRNETVTVTATPDDGLLFKGVKITDRYGDVLSVKNYETGVNAIWTNNNVSEFPKTVSFSMPNSDINIVPQFGEELEASDSLFLKTPVSGSETITIPSRVASFNVYDDGGKSSYTEKADGSLVLTAPEGYRFQVTGTIKTRYYHGAVLYIYDGDESGNVLVEQFSESEIPEGTATIYGDDIGTVVSAGNVMTIRFKSLDYYTIQGIELVVTLVSDIHKIKVAKASGGKLSSDKQKALQGETVTLTATPAEGYLFDGVSVEDADGNVVALSKDIHWYSGVSENVVTFSMPTNAVTVTPKFSSIDDLYVNMPTRGGIDVNIPENVTSFKIYDDGGKDGNYSNKVACELYVKYDKNSGNAGLKLSGSVSAPKDGVNLDVYAWDEDADAMDMFYMYQGSSDGHAEDIGTFINSSSLVFEFRTGNVGDGAGLDLRVDVVKSPGGGVEVVYDDAHVKGNGNLKRWATITDGDKTSKVNIPEDVDVESVDMTRTFTPDVYSTMVLPFSVSTEKVEGLKAALRYNGIKTVNGVSSIRMKVVWAAECVIKDDKGNCVSYKDTVLNANTPYMVLMGQGKLVVNGGVTLKKTAPADTSIDGWIFRGTWQYKKWGSKQENSENYDPETGYAYGFAASESGSGDNKISVGEFVRAGEGAWISPMRAYLVRADKAPVQGVRANGNYVMRPSFAQEELPELLNVVIDHGDGDEEHTTVIGHFNTRTGEFKMNNDAIKRTFDVKGRNVGDKASKARGAYYGKKVIAK